MSLRIDDLDLSKRFGEDDQETISEIRSIRRISVLDKRKLAQSRVSSTHGSIFRDLGRNCMRILVEGEFVGSGAREGISQLRSKYKMGEGLEFVSDLSIISNISKVLIERLNIRGLAGVPNYYSYQMVLRECVETPPESKTQDQQQQAEEQVEKETEIDDIRGQVLDADGNPAKGIKVKIKGPKGETEVQTDEEGYYELQDVPEGKYEITPVAGKEEGREGGEEAAAKEEEYTKTEVEIKKGGGSSGSSGGGSTNESS
jgi:hypothetical protein